ncbi:MAG: M24 family metallopeptidase [Chloroflexota bacterium]
MKSDIDRLMEAAGLDALFVRGGSEHNPAMAYFAGKAHLTQGYLLKKRGQAPVLFHGSMERDEAAQAGLQTKDLSEYNITELLEQTGGDLIQASVLLQRRLFEEFEVHGRVALYGRVEVGPVYSVLRRLEQELDGIELVGESESQSVLARARATKDAEEVERIRQMGKTTVGVVAEVATYLTSMQAKDGLLVNREGQPVTIGDIKRRINLWLAMRGGQHPEAVIFAQGRDAGVPHSTGDNVQAIAIGQPIIFDIFPCEVDGGYYYDFTRTWCLGYAPEDVLRAYEDVRAAHQTAIDELRVEVPCRQVQIAVCDHFESRGHPTQRTDPKTESGYVHGLGHGVGLAVHEAPFFSHLESNQDVVLGGSVFTIEPGLYYPERGFGVRLEDTVWMRPDGQAEVLAEFPYDLVLTVPGA